MFQETTAKISAPNSTYNCSIDQKFEVRFSSFCMGNQKAVGLLNLISIALNKFEDLIQFTRNSKSFAKSSLNTVTSPLILKVVNYEIIMK